MNVVKIAAGIGAAGDRLAWNSVSIALKPLG